MTMVIEYQDQPCCSYRHACQQQHRHGVAVKGVRQRPQDKGAREAPDGAASFHKRKADRCRFVIQECRGPAAGSRHHVVSEVQCEASSHPQPAAPNPVRT